MTGCRIQFDSLQLVGQASGDDAIDPLFKGQPLALASGGQSGERTDEMPLYLDLVNLTAAASTAGSSSPVSSSSSSASSIGAVVSAIALTLSARERWVATAHQESYCARTLIN